MDFKEHKEAWGVNEYGEKLWDNEKLPKPVFDYIDAAIEREKQEYLKTHTLEEYELTTRVSRDVTLYGSAAITIEEVISATEKISIQDLNLIAGKILETVGIDEIVVEITMQDYINKCNVVSRSTENPITNNKEIHFRVGDSNDR